MYDPSHRRGRAHSLESRMQWGIAADLWCRFPVMARRGDASRANDRLPTMGGARARFPADFIVA
jgi:hypothetical protein